MTAERAVPIAEQRHAVTHALLAGTARALGLLKRVPELVRKRGWSDDPDLSYVLAAAVALKVIGAGGTLLRRPQSADACGNRWPIEKRRLTASQIVDALELGDLVPEPRSLN